MKKVSSIELLRFISSFMILVWHYQQFYLPYNFFSNQEVYFNDKSMQPLFNIFKFFFVYGNYGVEFFFIISGFVFTYVYVDQKISFRNFFINRFARLYPLHLITLIVVLILQSISFKLYNEFLIYKNNDLYHFFLNFFLISGWGFEKGPSFNGPIWSVSVEIIIYFLFFYFFIFYKKSTFIKSIILIFFFIAFRKIFVTGNYSEIFFLNKNIINCGLLFFLGQFIYLLNKKINSNTKLFFIGIFFLALSLIGNFKLYIFLPSVLLLFINFERFLSKILKKIFNFLGNLTYGMYLWHLPIQIVMITIIKILNLKFDLIERELFFISYLLLVFSTSIFSYYFIEMKLRKKIKLKFKPT